MDIGWGDRRIELYWKINIDKYIAKGYYDVSIIPY